MMLFKTFHKFFTEFFFLNLLFTKRQKKFKKIRSFAGGQFIQAKLFYSNLLCLILLIGALTTLQQNIFFFSTMANFISHRPLFFDNNQGYTDRKAKLWGVTNRGILSPKQLSKGRESAFFPFSGLVINVAAKLLKPVKYSYLLRSENIIASVGLKLGNDYPLLVQPSPMREKFVLVFLHTMQRRFFDQFHTVHATFLMLGLLKRRKSAKLSKRSRLPTVVKLSTNLKKSAMQCNNLTYYRAQKGRSQKNVSTQRLQRIKLK